MRKLWESYRPQDSYKKVMGKFIVRKTVYEKVMGYL